MIPKKIPTLLGLALLAVLIGTIAFVSERFFRMPTAAFASDTPMETAVTNVTDSSLSVIWTTQRPTTGAVEIREPSGKKHVFFDERDVSAKALRKYPTHSVTVRNLTPATLYTFLILSNGRTFFDSGKPYQGETAPPIQTPTQGLGPAYGAVMIATNQPADGALVLLTIEGSQLLSSLVKPSGSWLIPLNLIRTQDLTRYLTPAGRMTETLTVSFNGQTTSAVTDTFNDSPVPTMIIGKSYDFRKQQAEGNSLLADQATSPKTAAVLGDQTGARPSSFTVTLASPNDGASFTTMLPLIEGTGVPGKLVAITIGITQPVSGSTTVGADGMWRFTPPVPIPQGKQSVTVTTQNTSGQPVAITHAFEILKSGSQVLGSATPSATLAPTPFFTPAPTSTLAGQPVPVSGSPLPTLLLIVLGLVLVTGGAVVFVK